MAWFYEILDKDDVVLEASEPMYATQFEAHRAGYKRAKERPEYFYRPIPPTDGKVDGGLQYLTSAYCAIRAREKI
jgi:hypothetical protein